MVFHKVSIYIYTHTYIRCKSGRVQRIQKSILKGILLVFPQGIVEDILQGMYRVYSIRYSVLFVTLNKLRLVEGFPRS